MIGLVEAASIVVMICASFAGTLRGRRGGNSRDIADGIFTITPRHRQALLTDTSRGPSPEELASSIRSFYEREGYVLIRGLFDKETIRKLQKAGELTLEENKSEGYVAKNFQRIKFGPIFMGLPPSSADKSVKTKVKRDAKSEENVLGAFRETALHSALPTFIAKILLKLDPTSSDKLRVINDVFLAKDGKEEQAAGWHVDDRGFWPSSAHQDPTVPFGVNAWIAVNDIPSKRIGGGMAIIPRSHLEEGHDWVREGYETIGSTKVDPIKGYGDAMELVQNMKGTTEMERTNPELHAKIDQLKKSFDYKEGDVLLMSRWLWHRSEQRKSKKGGNETFLRYTIRYDVGQTKVLSGVSTAPAVVFDESNAGKTLDEICQSTGLPFYPEAWPRLPGSIDKEEEANGMKKLVDEVIPNAMAASMELYAKMRKAYEGKLAKSQ